MSQLKKNNIFLNQFFYVYFFNCRLFFFFKTLIIIIIFFENLKNNFCNGISYLYFFLLKLNSDNNFIIILTLYFYLYFFKNKLYFYFICFYIDAIFLNSFINVLDISKTYVTLNSRLTNGLILIHPVLLYVGLIKFSFFSIKNIKDYFLSNIFFFKKNLQNFPFYEIFIFIYLSIFLGGVWAEQELG